MIKNDLFLNMLNSPVRFLTGRVNIFSGSTLELVCSSQDRLKSFTIERVGEKGKFFGFGICQKLSTHLLDKNRELSITTANTLQAEMGIANNYISTYPNFYVTEVNRDEKTNELSITAYDALYKATNYTVSQLLLDNSYNIKEFAQACAALLGITMKDIDISSFNTVYENGANFDGTETLREALNAVAEATQTIYFVDNNNELVFKRLDITSEADLIIDKEKYITLNTKTNRRLTNITHTTELGDNVSASLAISGTTQYIRNNPFWELREDIGALVDAALAAIGGITINQFTCTWRGNFLLEIGDKIELITKDNEKAISYVLDDVVKYTGALNGTTQWDYAANDNETASNPTSLGEVLKETYARVDKANKQIDLVASETSANKEAISALQINTNGISAAVSRIETETADNIEAANEEINKLKTSVAAQITPEEVSLQIQQELSTGVEEVNISGKDFTFDNRGLTIEDINPDTNNAIKTTLSNNGMTVNAKDTEVLVANDIGVNARNLRATSYLIINNTSRFEDYDGGRRTACFWIGGNS